MVQFNFDSRTVDPNTGGGGVLPGGTYDVVISDSEDKVTKAGTGKFLAITMTVTTGQYKGRRIIDRINYVNQNTTAVEIGLGTLSAICHVCGVPSIQDTVQLYNRPFKISVLEVPRNDDPSKTSNEIEAYMTKEGETPKPGQYAAGGNAQQPAMPTQPPQQVMPPQQNGQPPQTVQPPQQGYPQQPGMPPSGQYSQPPQQNTTPPWE